MAAVIRSVSVDRVLSIVFVHSCADKDQTGTGTDKTCLVCVPAHFAPPRSLCSGLRVGEMWPAARQTLCSDKVDRQADDPAAGAAYSGGELSPGASDGGACGFHKPGCPGGPVGAGASLVISI